MGILERRGVNTQYEYDKVRGSGTKLDPYERTVVVEELDSEIISELMGQTLASDVTLNANLTLDDEAFQVSSPSVVPAAGNFLCIAEGNRQTQVEVKTAVSAGGDDYDITTSMPIDFAYTTAAIMRLQNCDMNVNGSVTPATFSLCSLAPGASVKWDITRMIVSMVHGTAGDDGLFGNLAALTNGVYFRVENGTKKNLFNAKENSDFRVQGYDLLYPSRSGGLGNYGTTTRISFNGPEKRGAVIRLDPGETIIAKVRDDLSTLGRFRITFQGHVSDF